MENENESKKGLEKNDRWIGPKLSKRLVEKITVCGGEANEKMDENVVKKVI